MSRRVVDPEVRRARWAAIPLEKRRQMIAGARAKAVKVIASKTEFVSAYKAGKGCMVCKERDPVVLDLDHRDQATKKFGISKAIQSGKPMDEILEEIEKCDVLCANCHRRRTAAQCGWYAYQES